MTESTKNILASELRKRGITNQVMINGIIAQAFTEGASLNKAELSYRNTPVSRIREVFGKRLNKYTDAQLEQLKKNDIEFFDVVYGGQYGNIAKGDGFKYRGRGPNQITFKNNYYRVGKGIGVDLVANPDLLLQEPVGAAALAWYYADVFKAAQANGSLMARFKVSDVNKVNSNALAVKIALQANAGWAKNIETPFFTKVYDKALAYIQTNPTTSVAVVLVVLGLVFF